jgi:hypothetical protein
MKRPKTFFWYAGALTLAGLPLTVLFIIFS